jgi:hypothetical protein
MTSHQPTVTAYKRPRRSKKGNLSLREDDDDTIDTVTHEEIEILTSRGLVTKRVKVPLRPLPNESSVSTEVPPIPRTTPFTFESSYEDPPEDCFIQPKQKKV